MADPKSSRRRISRKRGHCCAPASTPKPKWPESLALAAIRSGVPAKKLIPPLPKQNPNKLLQKRKAETGKRSDIKDLTSGDHTKVKPNSPLCCSAWERDSSRARKGAKRRIFYGLRSGYTTKRAGECESNFLLTHESRTERGRPWQTSTKRK